MTRKQALIRVSPLSTAATYGHLGIAKLLIKYGADLNKRSPNDNLGILDIVIGKHAFKKFDQFALNTSCFWGSRNYYPSCAIAQLCSNNFFCNNNYFVKSELKTASTGSSIKPINCFAFFPIESDNLEMVELLIKSGIELEYKAEKYLMSPLHRAVNGGHYEIVKLLISHGADIFSRIYNENTPIHTAIFNNNIEIVKLLLSHGVKINIRGMKKHTLLQLAVFKWHYEIVEFLLENGADVNEEYCGGNTTLLHIACQNGGHNNITEILIKYGAKLDALDENGCAPIHFAADEGLHLIARNLLKKGNLQSFTILNCLYFKKALIMMKFFKNYRSKC